MRPVPKGNAPGIATAGSVKKTSVRSDALTTSGLVQAAKDARLVTRNMLDVLERLTKGFSELSPLEEDSLQKAQQLLPDLISEIISGAKATAVEIAIISPRRSSVSLHHQAQQESQAELGPPIHTGDVLREQQEDWLALKAVGSVKSTQSYQPPRSISKDAEEDWLAQRKAAAPAPAEIRAAPAAAPVATAAPIRHASITKKPTRQQPAPVEVPVVVEIREEDMHWRERLRTKKEREEKARLKAEEEAYQTEEARWVNVPAWKRVLLTEMAQKKEDREAPQRERERLEREAQERFNALPAWKQKLLMEKNGGS